MKKTLAALAVLGAFAGSAAAADVQLYGVVDEGFIYTNTKVTDEKSDNQFQLGSGLNLGSRWGLKGTEDLGNGYKVGFKLESGRYFDGRPLLCRCQGRLDRGCRSGLQVLRRFRPLRLPAQQAYERLRRCRLWPDLC